MEILIPIVINIALVVLIYLAEKRTAFGRMSYVKKQIIIGVLFGMLSCVASSLGVEVYGTVANVRDAAPISAGLLFGAPAGIIAGSIGGLFRWFSVFWGAGYETRLACSLATVLAGVMVAFMRKYMFDNKKPTWSYAIVITVFCEVVHMLLIFSTNMSNSVRAFELVRSFTVPMIFGNVIAVGLAILAVFLISSDGRKRKKPSQHIAETFQKWLLVCIVVAFLGTSVFTFVLQNGMLQIETRDIFNMAIGDVVVSVKQKSDAHMLDIVMDIKAKYVEDTTVDLDKLAVTDDYAVAEINIINTEGIIVNSTNPDFFGFDMMKDERSSQFMHVTRADGFFVQEYRSTVSDPTVMRKYAGVELATGEILQVGYSADQFHHMLDGFVIDVTKNRHVGTEGFVAVCDENFNLVIDDSYYGKHISSIGIEPSEEMLNGIPSASLCYTDIINTETGYFKQFIYVYTFVEGYCIIAAMPESDAMFMRDASLYTSLFMQVIIFAVLFVFIYILIKRVIINNIRKINTTLAQITEGNLNVTVDVRTNEEFSSLSDDINSTVSTLKRYIAEAAARIDKELEYAKQIQMSALPTDFPNGEEYAIFAQMIAAKEVGGDFYDFYKLSDTRVAVLAADVSGKGIPAAMFMMTAKTIIKDLAESGLPVNDIFTRANEKLCENNESGMFVTAWMGILDVNTGELQFANAGHNPPLIRRANGSFEYLRSRAGFVLAGMEGVKYRSNEIFLGAGDRLFLYTDGVTEATNGENALYGEDRLLDFMNGGQGMEAVELLTCLKSDIDAFVGDAPQFDDITMLMLDYKPMRGNKSMLCKSFRAEVNELSSLLSFVEEALESFDCPMKNQTAICIALEEVFVNVARYAYGEEGGDVSFALELREEDRLLSIRMEDRGIPFDPLKKPDPDVTLTAEEREIGGLGIFITKKTMDSLTYAYENGKNILTMTKKI